MRSDVRSEPRELRNPFTGQTIRGALHAAADGTPPDGPAFDVADYADVCRIA